MSIKEALERGPMDRGRTIRKRSDETQSPNPALVEDSRRTLRDSKAVQGVNELFEIIRETDPAAEVKERIRPDSSVSVEINWGRMPVEGGNFSPDHYYYNSMSVSADPFEDQIMVSSKEEDEFIRKPAWSSDPRIVEDAIVRAYRNPMKMMGPPQKM